MSKKKIIQRIAIFALLLGIILIIPNFNWNNSSIYGFISLLFGTVGSITSIFIPTNYTYFFDKSNWIKLDEDTFVIKIKVGKHGMGKSPQIEVFELINRQFESVGISSKHDINGSIQIEVPENCQFSGKVKIT